MLETKGYWDAEDRRKIKAVMRDNPDIDLRMVFQAPFNKISKKSKTTYAQWCEKHGIKWASAHAIPIDWLICNKKANLWHTNHVLTVARQMLTQFTLMVTSFAFRATRTPLRKGTHLTPK